jgi:hypothetical protein
VKDELAGKRGKCSCGKIVPIPKPAAQIITQFPGAQNVQRSKGSDFVDLCLRAHFISEPEDRKWDSDPSFGEYVMHSIYPDLTVPLWKRSRLWRSIRIFI